MVVTSVEHETLRATRARDSYTSVVGRAAIERALLFLNECGPTAALGLLLRMQPGAAKEIFSLAEGDYWIESLTRRSFGDPRHAAANDGETPIQIVRKVWSRCIETAPQWRGILELPSIHACTLRGPAEAVRNFLTSPEIQAPDSPVAGLIRDVPLTVPERTIPWHRLEEVESSILERVAELSRKCEEASAQGTDAVAQQVLLGLQDPQLVAALDFAQRLWSRLPWIRHGYLAESVRRILKWLGQHGHGNWNHLGDLARFGDFPGRDQKVILLDSGADESSPWLQQQIIDYVRIDAAGQRKNAHDCVDQACHGTKMASLIAGKPCTLAALGLTDRFAQNTIDAELADFHVGPQTPVRVGIAPGARLGVVSVLGGEFFAETGSVLQMTTGLNWVAESYLSGYQIVNISIEADRREFDADTRVALDAVFDLMKSRGMVALIAAGNHGADSAPLSENAWIVRADHGLPTEPDSDPTAANRLIAPGVDILCGQPRVQRLRNLTLNVYSGSSIATAITSGAVAALCGRCPGVSAREAVQALWDTSGGACISLDRALDRLLGISPSAD